MRELVFKDIRVMGKSLKAYTLFLGGYLALALMGLFELEIAVAMIHIVIIMLPLGAAAQNNWKGEGGTPISRRATVRARYCLVLLAAMVSGAAGLLGSVFLSLARLQAWQEHLSIVFRSLGTGLLVADLVLPFYCKPGQERMRPCLCVAVFLPVAILFGMFRLSVPAQSQRVLIGYLLLALVGLGVSFVVSCQAAEQNTEMKKGRQ